MHSIKLRSHIGKDRLLQIQLPEGIENTELDIVLVYQSVQESKQDVLSEKSKSIWQLSEDFVKDIPTEELNQLPNDGADQHDHYIYGIPKKEV
jgi:hypothetical protein